VDCTDLPHTRYLLSDASVRLGVPLVSGAAIGRSGQWAVYGGERRTRNNTRASAGTTGNAKRACYRCLWPSHVQGLGSGRCEDEGVWGPVVGMVGVGMAGEVLKLLTGNEGMSSAGRFALKRRCVVVEGNAH
jgi:adenylyltransferase/sulfurtransferase